MYQVFDTASLLRLGFSDREVRRAADCCLERVARGRFAVRRRCEDERHRRIWESIDQEESSLLELKNDFRDVFERLKILIRARANRVNSLRQVASGNLRSEVFSHISAALLWELEVSRPVDERVEVMRPEISRRHTNLLVRKRKLPPEHVDRIGDVAVTSLARTLIDIARDYSLDVSVPMLDNALRRNLVTNGELLNVMETANEMRNKNRLITAIDLMDPLRESPAESMVAVRFFENQILGFVPQVDVRDAQGRFVARVDFLHRQAMIIVEFDGRAKYFLNDRDHRTAFDRERERERQLRSLGYHVVRIFWKDLFRRQKFTELARLVNARVAQSSDT
ncbi:DUF559 domain-containing protein [Brevibacterium marinum]|uniref:Very-short-patch-repair endonuclease n=1 Tax=Brevibacterium marinum TaxID=418643 RepID=A0A846S3V7_9MICO|nr:DUF559 domain-containing protein [Brevibacterium marinum]NJC56811.1 very-short-patch-repair endonuclease [Brevibacterium marinum]